MYLIDWYDKNQCHHGNVDGHDRSNGRIFKVVYKNQKTTPIDLQKKTDAELVDLQLHVNDFYVRHARRILAERGGNAEVHKGLLKIVKDNPHEHRQLRGLWALQATGGLDEKTALELLKHKSEYVRAFTVQFLAEGKNPSDAALKRFAEMAAKDNSQVVRMYIASAMQRTPVEKRWDTLSALLAHAEDAKDHNLPYLYWYAAEGSIGTDTARSIKLLSEAKVPKVREFIARKLATGSKAVAAR